MLQGMDLKPPTTVLITGATSGLGAALAAEYAAPKRHLILHGRDSPRLEAIAARCEAQGARVTRELFDLCDADAATAALRRLAVDHALDLVIANAGVARAIGHGEELENYALGRAVLAVNLDGALLTVGGVLPSMRARGRGQIALISSLAAYVGMPITPTYCASKAGLKAYGEALRGWLAPQGIAVNVVLPGFVRTPMTASFPAATPTMISAARAALRIRRGLDRNQARIAFPPALAFGMWGLSVLPADFAQRVLRRFGFGA
jgi:short-subunit dehydrogenase